MRFREAVKKLDKLCGKGVYHHVVHGFTSYHNGETKQEKSLYIGDKGWFVGRTFEEAFVKLEANIKKEV